jgi:hypothetical protein
MRRLTRMLTLVLLLVLGSQLVVAQPQCPLQPTDVRNIERRIFILFRNTSTQPVTSYDFGLDFIDTFGVDHSFPISFVAKHEVPPQAAHIGIWKSDATLNFLYPVAIAHLLKASFADGSVWTDDGSGSCSIIAIQE